MSKKLSLSTALSVLMMAGYVLLGTEAFTAPIGPHALEAPSFAAPGQVFTSIR